MFHRSTISVFEKEGILPRDDKFIIKIPHNSWQKEMLWQDYTFEQLGMPQSQKDGWEHCGKAINVTNVGNWSTNEYLPMGYIQNTETGNGLFWQIEHNGSWHWEISDQRGHFTLRSADLTNSNLTGSRTLLPGKALRQFLLQSAYAVTLTRVWASLQDTAVRYAERIPITKSWRLFSTTI